MPESSDKPLLTFGVAAFKQERFVEEAVKGAFAQTYSPLEIILSDDCSPDRTFEIMREMAAAYRGPHRVVLNRNPVRRSIGGHVNRLVELARGELIVTAAGDDISLPDRTQLVYEAWEASGRQATSIHSGITQIDDVGRKIEQIFKRDCDRFSERFTQHRAEPLAYVRTLEPMIFGCAHSFSRRLFEIFGNLPDEVIHEDNSLAFRTALAGQFSFINLPLVQYRVHGHNVYITSQKYSTDLGNLRREEDRLCGGFKNRETMYRTFLLDLEKARQHGLIGDVEFQQASREAARLQARVGLMSRFLGGGFWQKCRMLPGLRRQEFNREEMNTLIRRLPPRSVLIGFRLLRAYTALLFSRISPA